jgi:hypothetical protein
VAGSHLLSLSRQRKKAKKGDRKPLPAARVPKANNDHPGSQTNSLPLQGAPPLASGYRSAGTEQCSAQSLPHLKHVCALIRLIIICLGKVSSG